jgi:hypothetical protein
VADGIDATAGKGEKGWRGTAYEETQDLMEEVDNSLFRLYQNSWFLSGGHRVLNSPHGL